EGTETAEKIEDLAPVPVVVVHALGPLDQDLVEAEQLEEMILAGVQMPAEQIGRFGHAERLRVLDAQQVRLRHQIGLRTHVIDTPSSFCVSENSLHALSRTPVSSPAAASCRTVRPPCALMPRRRARSEFMRACGSTSASTARNRSSFGYIALKPSAD